MNFCNNTGGICKYGLSDVYYLSKQKVLFLCGYDVVKQVLGSSVMEKRFEYEKSFVTKSLFGSELCYIYALVHPFGYVKFIQRTGIDYLKHLNTIGKELTDYV